MYWAADRSKTVISGKLGKQLSLLSLISRNPSLLYQTPSPSLQMAHIGNFTMLSKDTSDIRIVQATTNIHLALRLRMSEAAPPLTHMPSWRLQGLHLPQ